MKLPEQIIHSYIQAYNAIDISKMLSLFSDDCVFENISNSSPIVKVEGLKELKKIATASAQLFKEREQKIVHQVISQNEAAVRISYRAVLATGQSLELQGASFFEFQNGKIKRLIDLS